jgi:DtxR family Mn-dependent transcriptional regulator
VTLTERGSRVALRVVKRHNVIKSFFVDVLGVEERLAQEAACKAEHALGSGIVERLLDFIEFVRSGNGKGFDFSDEFRKYCESRKQSKRNTTNK